MGGLSISSVMAHSVVTVRHSARKGGVRHLSLWCLTPSRARESCLIQDPAEVGKRGQVPEEGYLTPGSLDRAVVCRREEDGFDLADQYAVFVALLVGSLPLRVVAEGFPGGLGGFAAGECQHVDELIALAVLGVLRLPEADDRHAVLLEHAVRHLAK